MQALAGLFEQMHSGGGFLFELSKQEQMLSTALLKAKTL